MYNAYVKTRRFVLVLTLAMGILPLLAYQMRLGKTPRLDVQQAIEMLADPAHNALLVDVRPYEQYSAGHPQGAANLPAGNLPKLNSLQQLSPELHQKRLILVDGSGWDSPAAAKQLQRLGKSDVAWIAGGIQQWQAHPPAGHALELVTTGSAAPVRAWPMFRLTSGWAQLWLGLSWLIIKPLYVLLALVVAFRLRKTTAPDLLAVKWACLLLVGAQIIGALAGKSVFMEYLHIYGVVLACSAFIYAAMQMIDTRLVRPNEDGFCPWCIEHLAGESCGLRRVLRLAAPLLIVLAILPLMVPLNESVYSTRMFDKPSVFMREGVYQAYEMRFLPAAAIALLAWAWWRLRRRGHPLQNTQIILAGAIAAIGFSWFRGMLLAVFEGDQAWYYIWQQGIALVFVLLIIRVLRTFRGALENAEAQPHG